MMETLRGMGEIVLGTIRDVVPIALIVLVFHWGVLRQKLRDLRRLGIGLVYVLAGLALFLVGLEQALFPLGRTMAEQLTALAEESSVGLTGPDWRGYLWVYVFALCLGFSTTIAEPALIAVAMKANEVSAGAIGVWGLRIAVATEVAIGVALGAYRIVVGASMHYFIIVGYVVVVLQTYFAPKMIVPLAYDSGGVSTSTVTVPLVAALGLGLAENVPGRNPLLDGFGLIAFACLFPIMSVMAYAQLSVLYDSVLHRRRAAAQRYRE